MRPRSLTGAAADRAAARFLDDDRPRRRRVADGSWLSRTELAPWHEWAAIGAFLDAPYDTWTRQGCTDQGCAAMRGGGGGEETRSPRPAHSGTPSTCRRRDPRAPSSGAAHRRDDAPRARPPLRRGPVLGGCVANPGGLFIACAKPGIADDQYQCWAVQNMSSISFMWAMTKRFTGLAGLACCPKTADTYFMTSEPDGLPLPDGNPSYDANEPFPYLSVPC